MLVVGGKVCKQKLVTTLLHGQLQDGLKHELMRAVAVSGGLELQGTLPCSPK